MSGRIDHFMYAVASLEQGMQWAADTFGVQPAYGGAHVGLGTHNALLSLGTTYLEIIAPDPDQPAQAGLGREFAQLTSGGLVTWAVQGALAQIATTLNAHDIQTLGPKRTQRRASDGTLLVWELLFTRGSAFGARLPFFIDWLDCAHPSTTNPVGGELQSLQITTPDAAFLQGLLDTLGVDCRVVEGEPRLAITIATGRGEVELSSTPQTSQLVMR